MKSYTAKTITGAQRRVRELQKQLDERDKLLDRWDHERKLLAKLAAESPQFYNPLVVLEAKQIRDRILTQAPNDGGQRSVRETSTNKEKL